MIEQIQQEMYSTSIKSMDRSFYVCLLLIHLGYTGHAYDVSQAPRCSDTLLDNPGYSSQIRDGLEIWTHCGFPNPKLEPGRCGRTGPATNGYDLCDPRNVISTDVAVQLDNLLWAFEITTPYQCTPFHGNKLNYTIILVAVQHIRIPDLSTNETCVNNCGELVPEMDVTVREPTEEEKQAAVDSFAQGLVSNYEGYFCNNFAVVAYWENEMMLSTAFTPGGNFIIPDEIIAEAQDLALSDIQANNTVEGIMSLATKYRDLVIGFTPAYVLLIVYVSVLVLIGVCLVFFFLFSAKSDYYDEELWKVVLKTSLKMLFGVWFIELALHVLLRVQEKLKVWHALVPLLGCLGAAGMAVFILLTDTN